MADLLVTVVAIVGLNRKLRNLEYVTSKLRQGSDKLGKDLSKGALRCTESAWQASAPWRRTGSGRLPA